MLRRHPLVLLPLALGLACAARAALTTVTAAAPSPTIVYLTSGTKWTVLANWNSSNNTIEASGGGGHGADGNSIGGGADSKISNLTLTPGATVIYRVGAGGSGAGAPGGNGADTYFKGSSCSGASVCAKGGQASAGVGAVKYSGGNGGSNTSDIGAGGGGADGGSAGRAPTGNNGAAGGKNHLGPGDGAGGTSASITDVAGTKGGGGAGGTAGGLYGGDASAYSGHGAPGIIVITYTPSSTRGDPAPTATLTASPTSITSGGSSTLTWSSTNATTCFGTGFTASGTSGSASVSPVQTTKYSITCTGSGGTSLPASATVTASAQNSSLSVPFTPLHIYYMSPTGSDSNIGTSPSLPWATPNHAVDCGDVIIAVPGDYTAWNSGIAVTSQPSSCPSTSGGIDGTGGVYFATVLCAGDLGSCYVNGTVTGSDYTDIVAVSASNWAFEGWQFSSNSIGSSGMRGFEAYACGSATYHHIAFVNDIVTHANEAYGGEDCANGSAVPGVGVDYVAVVGSIAQNANDDSICLAAIDGTGAANSDTKPGVHLFFGGNFAINNQNPACTSSDGEAMMFDTLDQHGYQATVVAENNILYSSAWANLNIFQQAYNSSSLDLQIFNNTSYHSNVCAPWNTYSAGGMNIDLIGGFPWTVDLYNNIDDEDVAKAGCSGGGGIYAMVAGGASGPTFNAGGSATQNIFHAVFGTCNGTCDPGNNVAAFNGYSYGMNTYEDAGFANTSDLLANHVGEPNCSSYTNTTACMGWNYSTQTAATDSVIGDLTPTASGTSGKGYQPPGTCKPDSYYPAWLKGIVYLQWDGTNLWEYNGLVQKPCGL